MLSFVRVRLFLFAAVFASGCYDSHPCGEEDLCDFADNDCDDRIDETFTNEQGVYASDENCGGCGVRCSEVFPTAAATHCEVTGDVARCVLDACPQGFHLATEGVCVPDVPALCLACDGDSECSLRQPGARCHHVGDAPGYCVTSCGEGDCGAGFACEDGFCLPTSGVCTCTPETVGTELGCLIERDAGYRCAGAMVCTEDGLGSCEPALDEACNGQDDDCNGNIDETFRNERQQYVHELHCGSCDSPCVVPGPHMLATCEATMPVPECNIECEPGFVDVDRIPATGCECQRVTGDGPPPAVGGDSDCDGVPDETTDYVYVTTSGSDTNRGTLEEPMRTLAAAVQRARAESKDVLVARGIYDGQVNLAAGVSIFGGYRPDFRERDLALFPVVLEHRTGEQGLPVVLCRAISEATMVDGLSIQGSDATSPGRGSTAVYLDNCGAEVVLSDVTILAGRGADGLRGQSTSERLAMMGTSLANLDGPSGTSGFDGGEGAACNAPGGNGGVRVCPDRVEVSGGGGASTSCAPLSCVSGAACGNGGCTDFTTAGVCDFDAVLASAVANPAANPGRGPDPGVPGERSYDAPTNRGVCNFCDDNPTLERNGVRGADGGEGGDGRGGQGCALAHALDAATGRVSGSSGSDGTPGSHGSGGGGGSSGAGYNVIDGTAGTCNDRSGASGGGGGAGGCGALGAQAGTGGGSSVGIAVRLRAGVGPRLERVRIVTASGGSGGDGGQGAAGGSGGAGSPGGTARFWCARSGGRGGDGGRGGAGGGGGGGCGGSSHGVLVAAEGASAEAWRATAMVEVNATGVPGFGGMGGFSPGASGASGRDGSGDTLFVLP